MRSFFLVLLVLRSAFCLYWASTSGLGVGLRSVLIISDGSTGLLGACSGRALWRCGVREGARRSFLALSLSNICSLLSKFIGSSPRCPRLRLFFGRLALEIYVFFSDVLKFWLWRARLLLCSSDILVIALFFLFLR